MIRPEPTSSPTGLMPEFEVYDPNGALVGTFTGPARLDLTAGMTGAYEVHVLSADGTSTGEYVLNVDRHHRRTRSVRGHQQHDPATGAVVASAVELHGDLQPPGPGQLAVGR